MPKNAMLLVSAFAVCLVAGGCATPQDQLGIRVSDSQLVARAEAVRSQYPEEGEDTWKALAELLEPGMTIRQMLLIIPAGNDRVPATCPRHVWVDRCVPGFDAAAFTVWYYLDGDLVITGVGHGIQEEADEATGSAGTLGARWDKLILDRKPWVARRAVPTAAPSVVAPTH